MVQLKLDRVIDELETANEANYNAMGTFETLSKPFAAMLAHRLGRLVNQFIATVQLSMSQERLNLCSTTFSQCRMAFFLPSPWGHCCEREP